MVLKDKLPESVKVAPPAKFTVPMVCEAAVFTVPPAPVTFKLVMVAAPVPDTVNVLSLFRATLVIVTSDAAVPDKVKVVPLMEEPTSSVVMFVLKAPLFLVRVMLGAINVPTVKEAPPPSPSAVPFPPFDPLDT